MKKLSLIVLAILVLISCSVVYLLITSDAELSQDDMANTDQRASETTPQPMNESTSPGAYIDYSEEAISNTTGVKILFFHAPWCPQCRALEADIRSKGVPDGVTIIKVDYDTNQALRKKYGVALQTTLVRINDNSELVMKFVAYDEPSVEAIKNKLL